jgi:hypothetical protein
MDSYTFATALGGAGLVAMAALGVSHLSGHGDTGSVTGGAGHVHGGHAGHSHLPAALRTGGRGSRGTGRARLASLLSPRVLFSAVLGFGVTGLLLRPLIGGVVLAAAAVAGGILFEGAIVRPVWNLLFRFASTPASSLEGTLFSEATAASGFAANGQGLVALEVDGHLVQCLGTLRESDRALGIRVHSGDVLRVEDVDPARSRCTVSYVQRGAR